MRPYQPEGLWNKVGGARVEYVVSPGEDRYRRGIYVVWKHSAPYPSFVNFDATARLACTVRRSRTNTPLQALTLLNDPVYVEAALALAGRAVAETPGAGVDERITHAFRLCLARPPRDAELTALRRLFESAQGAARSNPAGARVDRRPVAPAGRLRGGVRGLVRCGDGPPQPRRDDHERLTLMHPDEQRWRHLCRRTFFKRTGFALGSIALGTLLGEPPRRGAGG